MVSFQRLRFSKVVGEHLDKAYFQLECWFSFPSLFSADLSSLFDIQVALREAAVVGGRRLMRY